MMLTQSSTQRLTEDFNMRKYRLTNMLNGLSVIVHKTTQHSASSYGLPVWVDDEGEAYCQVGLEAPFYTVESI